MECTNSKELLAALKFYMNTHDIQQKDLAATMGRKTQSISQIFNYGNPKCSTFFEMLNALNLHLEIKFVSNDTKQ